MNTALKGFFIVVGVIVFLSLLSFFTKSSLWCENDAGEKVIFSYDSDFNTVDIGGQPTHTAGSSWVDFLAAEADGFILVTSQNTQDPETLAVRPVKYVERYRVNDGYEHWRDVPPQDAATIRDISDRPSQQPDKVFSHCEQKTAGRSLQLFLATLRA